MSYNILNKNVNFQGATQGTIEDIVDLHTEQTITGKKTVTYLTASNLSVSNKLGIGTDNPSEPLHVMTTGNGGVEIEATSGAATLTFDMASNDEGRILFKEATESRASIIYDGTGAHSMIFKGRGTNTEVMRINSAGNIGIGTNNPSTKLHVDGNITTTNLTASGTVTVTGVISGSSAVSGSKFFGDGSALTGVGVSLAGGSGLTNSGGLRVDPSQSTAIAGSINDNDSVIVYSTADSAPRKVTVADIAGRASVPITTYTNTGAKANRMIVSIDGVGVKTQSNLIFDNTLLSLTGSLSGSGDLQVGGNITGSAQMILPNIATGSIAGPGSFLALSAAGKVVLTSGGTFDIDSYSALGGTGLHQTQDHFVFSDNGTEKKITFSNLEDAIFGNVGGNISIAAGGSTTISSEAIQSGMLNPNVITNLSAHGGSINQAAELMISDAGLLKVTFSDLEDKIFANVSGDATVAAGGALTIAANAVEGSMLNSNVAGSGLDYGSNELSVDVSDFMANGVDNRVLTATGTDAMTGEANLTFNGSLLTINGTGSSDRFVIGDTDPAESRLLVSGSNTDYLIQYKQSGNGYPTMFLAGEAHSSFAGVFYNRDTFVNAGAISQGNLPGGNGSHVRMTVRKTSISDNSATDVVTITIPNANHAAAIRVFGLANFDGCTYAQSFSFEGTIARASGTPTDKAFSSVTTTENASITPNFSIAVAGSSNTGANGATQTFTLQFTINTSDGSSSNATFMIELINFNDSGITMAAT